MENNKTKERGKLLTVILILGTISLFTAPLVILKPDIIKLAYGYVPTWYPAYLLISTIVGAIKIVGLWLWKKWSWYLIAMTQIIGILMAFFLLKPVHQSSYIGFIPSSIGFVILVWAIYRKRHYFT